MKEGKYEVKKGGSSCYRYFCKGEKSYQREKNPHHQLYSFSPEAVFHRHAAVQMFRARSSSTWLPGVLQMRSKQGCLWLCWVGSKGERKHDVRKAVIVECCGVKLKVSCVRHIQRLPCAKEENFFNFYFLKRMIFLFIKCTGTWHYSVLLGAGVFLPFNESKVQCLISSGALLRFQKKNSKKWKKMEKKYLIK